MSSRSTRKEGLSDGSRTLMTKTTITSGNTWNTTESSSPTLTLPKDLASNTTRLILSKYLFIQARRT